MGRLTGRPFRYTGDEMSEWEEIRQWSWKQWLFALACGPGLLLSPSVAYAIGWKWLWDATIWMLVILLGFIPAVMGLIAMVLLPVRVLLWLYRLLRPASASPRDAGYTLPPATAPCRTGRGRSGRD